jgi:hypothetical protein
VAQMVQLAQLVQTIGSIVGSIIQLSAQLLQMSRRGATSTREERVDMDALYMMWLYGVVYMMWLYMMWLYGVVYMLRYI